MRDHFCRSAIVAAAVGLTVLTSLPALAESNRDTGWQLRFNGGIVDAGSSVYSTRLEGRRYRSNVDVGSGISVGAEYLVRPRLGVEVALLAGAAVDTEVLLQSPSRSRVAVETLAFTPLMVGVNFHLRPGRKADVYAGPLLAHVRYSDLELAAVPARAVIRVDDELCLGAVIGLDVGVGNRGWFFNTQLRYLASDLRAESDGESLVSDFDPLITAVGFGYRF